MTRRIGLLTGGGDCPGLNAVIWAVVCAAAREHIEVIGIEEGFEGLVAGGTVRPITLEDVHGVMSVGGTMLGTTNRGNPFRYRVERNGEIIEEDCSDDVLRAMARLRLDGLIVIGGDGSLAIANELTAKGVKVIGVPKTIDNDLAATDTTFGFFTAVDTAMEALDRLKTTAESHDRVMILEVMGRYAGWIALYTGLAGGAHVILLPEIPYDLKAVVAKLRSRQDDEGKDYSLVVVAEGAHPAGGEPLHLKQTMVGTAPRVAGAGLRLEKALKGAFAEIWERDRDRPEIRTTVLGHVQRGGSPCAFDRVISIRFGTAAVDHVVRGEWNRMVCLRGTEIASVPLADAVTSAKQVEVQGQFVQAARAVGICVGDQWP